MEARVYLTKADNSLKAAQLCFENGLYDDAVSRAYYCVLRGAIALLLKIGKKEDVKRIHSWVQGTFPRECVHRRKMIPKDIAAYFFKLQNDRNTADYQPTSVSKRTATGALTKAKKFLDLISQHIERG